MLAASRGQSRHCLAHKYEYSCRKMWVCYQTRPDPAFLAGLPLQDCAGPYLRREWMGRSCCWQRAHFISLHNSPRTGRSLKMGAAAHMSSNKKQTVKQEWIPKKEKKKKKVQEGSDVGCPGFENSDSGVRPVGFKSGLCLVAAVWPRESHFIFLYHGFLTSKIEKLVGTASQDCCEDWMN